MAKSVPASKDGRTRKRFCFSAAEMDVARQLLQLSSETNDRRNRYDNNDNSCAEAEQRRRGGATDESSTNNKIGEKSEDQEEDGGIRWPGKRRFRSVYHLYRSTKPVAVVRAKRRKCTV